MRIPIFILTALACIATSAQNATTDTIKSTELNEIIVHGEKPHVKSKDGIMVVDLVSIVKGKPVTNIFEALSFLPGITNNDGSIGLSGASSVTVILNGELTDMPVNSIYQLLYTIPVSRLKNVEIMYTAPAKYHADGAVINIVLKTPNPIDGLMAEARIGYNQAHYASYGSALSATYAVKNWTFDINYNLSKSNIWNNEHSYSNHLYNGIRTMIDEDSRRSNYSLSNIIYASTGYNFSSKSNIKLTYSGQITSDISAKSTTFSNLGNYINNIKYLSPICYHYVVLRYSSPFGMTISGNYTNFQENRTQHLFTLPTRTDIAIASNRQQINCYHIYIDQVHDINDWQLGYGIEYQHSDDHSSQNYELPTQPGFNGTTKENVADAYISIQHTFPWGLSFNASAKGEYYHNTYKHNWNFIPQFGATYYKSPKNILQLNFTTQKIYPSYWELRGGTSYLNNYSKVSGNPMLQPYLDYSGQLSYILMQKYVATIYVQYADKATVQLPYQLPDELKLVYQTINMNYKRTIGLNFNIPFDINHIWNASTTLNVFNQKEKADCFHDISFNNKKWIFYGALNNNIRFNQNCPVSLSVDFAYISPSIQGIANLSDMWKLDAGIKYTFGKKQCCELNLKANDIFNRWSPTMTINHAGQNYRMKIHKMTQNVKLTLIWRFNGFKPKDTSFDTSRFGTGK
ncbi:outer membrane beta-barrel family protein [uncultured Muribaculum sp.]|uniref:outer membrane beta-barrel family protein n=1 Tax=uncultured Muribaculum sp. TaxID=1918613 RepID=UPI002674DB4E|nr:outer membrane beta-barrel family protein [uncultured Muribaculum sp.]